MSPRFVAAVSAVVLAAGCERTAKPRYMIAEELLAIPPPPSDFQISYGGEPQQFGELRLPPGHGPHPVAILIHGGCWLAEFDLRHAGPLAAALTSEGFATWNLEYRRVGDPGGGWPGTFQDVAAGADYVRQLAGRHNLDLSKVIVLGHSAGGHLALWLASRPKLPPGSPIHRPNPLALRGVVSLAGVADLGRREHQELCGQVVKRLMGGSPSEVPDRYLQGSPIRMLPIGRPQILIHGQGDTTVSLKSARDYEAAARSAGDDVRLVVIENTGHLEPVIPAGAVWPAIREAGSALIR